MINVRLKSNKPQGNLRMLLKLMLAFLTNKKEKNMMLAESISTEKEALIWGKVSQASVIWAEWEEKVEHLSLQQIWEEQESILNKYSECSSNKMVEWEVLIQDLVGLVLEVNLVIQEEWALMDHKVM